METTYRLPHYINLALTDLEIALEMLKIVENRLARAESHAGMGGDQDAVDAIDNTQPLTADLRSEINGAINRLKGE